MTDANNTEDTPRNGRRATDNQCPEDLLSSKTSGLWSIVRNSVGVAFVLTVCVGIGRFSNTVDTNVKDIDHNKVAIRELLDQNRDLIIVLKEQNIQQKESDKRFEDKFDRVIDRLKDVDDSVRDNKKDIIIMQQKISKMDKTSVYLAMR
jgi:hypothetical protein